MNDDEKSLHRLMGLLRSIDAGLIVLDENFTVKVWNEFMTNHSGIRGEHIIGSNLFEKFTDLPEQWLVNKTQSVFMLNNKAFTTWEQRPYLFKFKNYRPITGAADFMYQNITFIPLSADNAVVDHLGMIIYDVTDIAIGKTELDKLKLELERTATKQQAVK